MLAAASPGQNLVTVTPWIGIEAVDHRVVVGTDNVDRNRRVEIRRFAAEKAPGGVGDLMRPGLRAVGMKGGDVPTEIDVDALPMAHYLTQAGEHGPGPDRFQSGDLIGAEIEGRQLRRLDLFDLGATGIKFTDRLFQPSNRRRIVEPSADLGGFDGVETETGNNVRHIRHPRSQEYHALSGQHLPDIPSPGLGMNRRKQPFGFGKLGGKIIGKQIGMIPGHILRQTTNRVEQRSKIDLMRIEPRMQGRLELPVVTEQPPDIEKTAIDSPHNLGGETFEGSKDPLPVLQDTAQRLGEGAGRTDQIEKIRRGYGETDCLLFRNKIDRVGFLKKYAPFAEITPGRDKRTAQLRVAGIIEPDGAPLNKKKLGWSSDTVGNNCLAADKNPPLH